MQHLLINYNSKITFSLRSIFWDKIMDEIMSGIIDDITNEIEGD